jgi:mRNA interferase MazF
VRSFSSRSPSRTCRSPSCGRPLCLPPLGKANFILCQLTSNSYVDPSAIEVANGDLLRGSLHRTSFARPGKLFTANDSLIVREVGVLKPVMRNRVVEAVVQILHGPKP